MASNEVANAHPEISGIIDATKTYMYEELWKLCAGPLTNLPKLGAKVYYFPQGHIEQLEECTNEKMNHMNQIFDLPSKLQCRVTSIQLEVEKDTDEVYSKIILMPDLVQNAIPIPNSYHQRPVVSSFSKILTASDTSIHGGLTVLKRHAIECLPPLDMSQPIPNQELVAKDLYGYEWRFKHIFRGSTPQRHLFTTGWSAFVTVKRLVAGDSFIFLRGENGELQVGIRRAVHQRNNIASSIISTETMHHGVIASAMHAINVHCTFDVVYRPRSSQFVISYEKLVDAANNNFNVGSRFHMRFEGENFTERRYYGTVVGIKDFSPWWKDSEWRRLNVQWDELASFPRPNKVSPWEIEHLGSSSKKFQSPSLKNDIFCQGSTSTNMWTPTLTQGQEIGQSSMDYPINVAQLSYHNAIEDLKTPSSLLIGSCSTPTMAKPNYNNHMILPVKENIISDSTTSCILFGVNLMIPSKTKDSLGPIDSYQKHEISKHFKEKNINPSQIHASLKEVKNKQINYTRNRTNVYVQGVDGSRTIDLTDFDGYNQLIDEFEKLFNFKGELRSYNQWEIVFKDNDGDMMLIGDDSWPEFCNMVKKDFIYSKEEVKRTNSGNKFF